MTKIRGGRQAFEQLLADFQMMRRALSDIRRHSTVASLVEDVADDGLAAAKSADVLINDIIGPMLERRDRAGSRDLADILERLAELEVRLADVEREQRALPQLREVKRERG